MTAACVAFTAAVESRAQNDWQFPDPYFGILEIEKSRPPVGERRYRAEVSPSPRTHQRRPRLLRPGRRHVQPLQR